MKSGRLELQWSNITWIKVDRLQREKRYQALQTADIKLEENLPEPTPIPAQHIENNLDINTQAQAYYNNTTTITTPQTTDIT